MSFTLSQIIKPQFVNGTTPTRLTLVVDVNGTIASTVPNGTQLSLLTCRFVNVTGSSATLKVWRVVAGGTAVNQYVVVSTITIPVATLAQPYFDWSPRIQLAVGDAIFAQSGTASAISVSGDGGIST